MNKLNDVELQVLCTVVKAEVADMEAENRFREMQGLSPAFDSYISENYNLLCAQLKIILNGSSSTEIEENNG